MSETREVFEEFSGAQHDHLKDRCKTDLYFLAKGVLGYDQLEEHAHAALCAFIVREQSNRRMVLMPRGFLKSTICTIADSVRLPLINPNVRILIQNEVFENAAGFLEEIKNHWIKCETLRLLFPELVPVKTVGPGSDWAKNAASIHRTSSKKESTYTASGSGGSPQSQHFERVKNDDLIGEKAKESSTEMTKAIRWADAMTPLLDRLSDTMDWYGTRKTLSDVYAHIIRKNASRIKVFLRLPIEHGEAIFSKFPLEELQRIMVDTPDVWAYDYMNNPVGEGGLDWGNLHTQYFELDEKNHRVIFIDPLSNDLVSWQLNELFVTITVDPNSGKLQAPDKAAIVVHGTSPRGEIFTLDVIDERWTPDGLIDAWFDLAVKWMPARCGFEDAGQQNTLYYAEKKMQEMGRFFELRPTSHGNKEKQVRIRQALDTPLKKKKLFFRRDQLTLISQVQMHPQLADHNWDLIDCLAQGPQVYADGVAQKDLDDAAEADKKILSIRGRTGYGVSIHRSRGA